MSKIINFIKADHLFCTIELVNNSIITTTGKLGTKGKIEKKRCKDKQDADANFQLQIWYKRHEGYKQVTNLQPQKAKQDINLKSNYQRFWKSLDDNWKKVFAEYMRLSPKQAPTDSDIQNLLSTTQLHISSNKVNNFKLLSNFKALEELRLNGCKYFSSIKDIATLKNLKSLEIKNTSVSSLAGVENLKKLYYLNAGNTKITDLKPCKKLLHLESLYIADTDIKDLAPLTTLKKLSKIFIFGTKVTDLDPLHKIKSLEAIHSNFLKLKTLGLFLKSTNRVKSLGIKGIKLPKEELLRIKNNKVFRK